MATSGQIVKLEEVKRYGVRGSASLLWGLGGGAPSAGSKTCRACRVFQYFRAFSVVRF